MLLDANLLLYAVDTTSPFHDRARPWLEDTLNGPRRIGLPWPSLTAFVRIATNPRALAEPLRPSDAWSLVRSWLDVPTAWIPVPTDGHAEILGHLVVDLDLRANQIPDAHLAALAIEHGLTIASADTDFARFAEVRWDNPLVVS
ncbi:MAG TPA: type II toxin-antitoxin system VapC family toxin [Acidimicrobiales bacterium]